MNITLHVPTIDQVHPDPIKNTTAEPWLWEVLAEGLMHDPGFRFFFGDKFSETKMVRFMEAAVRGALESGGAVFSSCDRKVVLVWRWYGQEMPAEYIQEIFHLLGTEGTKRYLWFREATDVPIEPAYRTSTMRPQYIGVLPDSQGRGYGSHILKWTLDYFDQQGFKIPFLVASTRRSAKLYGPLLGFDADKEVYLGLDGEAPAVVVMKRKSDR